MFNFTNRRTSRSSPSSDPNAGDSGGGVNEDDGSEIAALRRMLLESERRHQEEREAMKKQIADLTAAMEVVGGKGGGDNVIGTNGNGGNGFLNRTNSAAPMFLRSHSESASLMTVYGDGSSDRSYTPPPRSTSLRARTSTIETKDVPPELLINKEDIQLLGLIGRGSFGEVWRALYKEEVVAVKVFISEEGDVASEIKVMARASSASNILSMVGVVIQDDPHEASQVAIVTKYMSNGSMHDMLVNEEAANYHGKSIPILDLISMSTQAALGVLNLHTRGIIHRDLACRNLLVDADLNVYVCDFGFARLRATGKSKGFTATNLGPVRWEAPESLKYKEFSEKTDVFSFGISMYEMFSGLEPYFGSTNAAVAYKVLSGERMRIPLNVDPVVAGLITSCWSPNPSARPEMREVYKCLLNRSHGLQNADRAISSGANIVTFLRRGGVLVKVPFNTGGKVFKRGKNRFFKVSEDLRSLTWERIQSKTLGLKSPERTLLLSEVLDILVGGVSANFLRHYGEAASQVAEEVRAPKAAFSLMTKDRSIDVICPTLESMNEWVRGLKYLINRLTTTGKDEIESVQGIAGLDKDAEKLGVVEGVKRWSKEKEKWNQEEVMSLKRLTLSRLIIGSSLLKFLHVGKPHERFFTLHQSLRHLLWEGGREGKKSKRVNLLEVKEIRTQGDFGKEYSVNVKGFHVKNKLAASLIKETVPGLKDKKEQTHQTHEGADYGITLVDFDGERVLNLIAPNEGVYIVWLYGLRWALEEISVLYEKEYPPPGARLVKPGKSMTKKRVTKRLAEAAVAAGRRGSRGINSMLNRTPGSTPKQTPVHTPSGSPTHSPSISRQSSAGSQGFMGDRNYDVFSDIGSAAGSGGESEGEGIGVTVRTKNGLPVPGVIKRFDSNKSVDSGGDRVADHRVVEFNDVEVGGMSESEGGEEADSGDDGYEGGVSERNVNVIAHQGKKLKKKKSDRGKKKSNFGLKDFKVIWNL